MRDALASAPFAAAAHAVLLSHAAAMPSLPRLPLAQSAAALAKMGDRLRFMRSCRARMVLRDGGSDVTRDGTALQVLQEDAGRQRHTLDCNWLALARAHKFKMPPPTLCGF